jgi:drug/metabolite transporter (DMT)-like permease
MGGERPYPRAENPGTMRRFVSARLSRLRRSTVARAGALAPLTAAALWGGMYVVSKWGFGSVPPITLGFLRVAIAAPVLLVLVGATGPAPDFAAPEKRRLGVLAAWVAASLATQFLGTDLTTASQGSLLTVLTPVAVLGLGVVWLDEALSRRKVGGMALAVAGTLGVLWGQYDPAALAADAGAGVLLLVVASVTWAAFTVQGAPLVRRYSALETTAYATLASVPLLGVLALAELALVGLPAVPTLPVVGAVLYLSLGSTAAAWVLWYTGIEYVEAGTVAVFFFAQPVVGTALGVLLLDEQVGAGFLVGGAVLCAGIYLVSTAESP